MAVEIEITDELRPIAEHIINSILAEPWVAEQHGESGAEHLRAHLFAKMDCTGKLCSQWPYNDESARCSRAHLWLEDVAAGSIWHALGGAGAPKDASGA